VAITHRVALGKSDVSAITCGFPVDAFRDAHRVGLRSGEARVVAPSGGVDGISPRETFSAAESEFFSVDVPCGVGNLLRSVCWVSFGCEAGRRLGSPSKKTEGGQTLNEKVSIFPLTYKRPELRS
jgi:hypothetical protein